MILKTTRWKNTQFGNLISYVIFDKGRTKPLDTFTITHNLNSFPNDIDGLSQEFSSNDVFRKKIKNGVVMYHEMLSFSPEDAEKINIKMLEQIAHKYISIRAPEGICVVKPHISTSNPHLHFCWHGTLYKSSETLRMDNAEFLRVRLDIERFQQERFPMLNKSLVYLNKIEKTRNNIQGDKNTRKTKENAFKKRTRKPLQKEALSIHLNKLLKQSQTLKEFYNTVEKAGYELYEYKGKVKGIKTNRKWRFKTLMVDLKALEIQQEVIYNRIKELKVLELRDINEKIKNR